MFKSLNALRLATVGAALSTAAAAHAALPAGIEDAIDAAQTDGLTLVAAMAVLGATVFILYRVIKKVMGS